MQDRIVAAPSSAGEGAASRERRREPFFRRVAYTGSFPNLELAPEIDAPLVAFTGRSNSGKSSLISALCDHKNLARTSAAPGKTRALNYFRVPEEAEPPHGLWLVDLPGYGYAKVSKTERAALRKLVDSFLAQAPVELLILVLDARRKLETEEESIVAFCRETERPILFARSKWDKLNAKEKKEARASWKAAGLSAESVPVSSTDGDGLQEVLQRIRAVAAEASRSA